MDTGEGYHRDVEYRVNIRKHLDGNIVLSVEGMGTLSTITYFPDGDISSGIERLGIIMRRNFDTVHKEKFLEWVHESEPA